jgi:FAD/FMN-containing dehydrogenase
MAGGTNGSNGLDRAAVEGLRPGFAGQLLTPGDEGYDAARKVWNGAIDRRPALIARCIGVADVIAAVRFGRERGLLVSVRGGGHGVSGHAVCDDGLMIDLSPMRGIRVDPVRRTVRAQAGVLWGEFDRECQAFGLATTGGIVTHTGVAGLTLGGGIGWLMRRHGLTIDNLQSVDVVTAEGEFLTAADAENPDLFWGVRGGGGNFGIATSFEFRLHPVGPTVLAGPIIHELDRGQEALRFYKDFIGTAPDELTTIVNLRFAPPLPFIPEWLRGRPIVAIVVCYCGPVDRGQEVLRPLREFGPPAVDLVAPKPYLLHQAFLDPTVLHGWNYYWKSWDLEPLSDAAIDVIVDHASRMTSPLSSFPIFQLGGAVAAVDEDATSYGHRGAAHNININAIWTDDPEPERHVQWVRDFWSAMEPFSAGVYVNFLADEGQERVAEAYGAKKHARLVELKTKYDPTNFFRLNQNIVPVG